MSHTCASSFWRTLSVVSASVLSICLSRGPKIRCCTPLCLTCNARRCCLSDRYRKTVVCPTDIARRCCLATGIATRCCLSASIARRCCLSDRYRNSVIYLQVSQDTFVCLTGIARCCCLSTGIARCCCLSTGVARRCCLSDRYRKMLLFVYRYRNTLLLVWQAWQDSAVLSNRYLKTLLFVHQVSQGRDPQGQAPNPKGTPQEADGRHDKAIAPSVFRHLCE